MNDPSEWVAHVYWINRTERRAYLDRLGFFSRHYQRAVHHSIKTAEFITKAAIEYMKQEQEK